MSSEPATEYDDYSFVKYTDSSVVSLVCYEGRHASCPQRENADGEPLNTPFEGYACECACPHKPIAEREPDPERKPFPRDDLTQAIVLTAGEYWLYYGADDPHDILSDWQRQAIAAAKSEYLDDEPEGT